MNDLFGSTKMTEFYTPISRIPRMYMWNHNLLNFLNYLTLIQNTQSS